MKIEDIAKICHEANRALCETAGDYSQEIWEKAPSWQRESAMEGVKFVIEYPNAPASGQHDSWLQHKLADGWVFGEVKDEVAKTHPCIVPYRELSEHQQAKDLLFQAVCRALVPLL